MRKRWAVLLVFTTRTDDVAFQLDSFWTRRRARQACKNHAEFVTRWFPTGVDGTRISVELHKL